MNEADNRGTSVLLPSSSVSIYTKDPETLRAAQETEKDWRFARVKIKTVDGDVETAIQAYKEYASPDLVMIQTDTIDEAFTDRLEALAGHCDEGTGAVVIGPVNDVNLYRRLIDMGVGDYLVRPIEKTVLADVIAKTLIEKIGITGSRLITFLGAKGGVGTSVLAQAMACGIADILGHKTVFLDTAGGWSTAAVGLGFEPATTLAEAAKVAAGNDEDSLNRMLLPLGEKLNVLSSGGDVMLEPTITAEQLEMLVGKLMVKYPVVIADLSQSPDILRKIMLTRANQIVLVATPMLPALRLGRSVMQEIKEARNGGHMDLALVINMQGMAPAFEVGKKDIEAAMECPVAAQIPFDPKIFCANEHESRKLTDDAAGRRLVEQTLLPLVAKDLGGGLEGDTPPPEKSGVLNGFLRKISSKS